MSLQRNGRSESELKSHTSRKFRFRHKDRKRRWMCLLIVRKLKEVLLDGLYLSSANIKERNGGNIKFRKRGKSLKQPSEEEGTLKIKVIAESHKFILAPRYTVVLFSPAALSSQGIEVR